MSSWNAGNSSFGSLVNVIPLTVAGDATPECRLFLMLNRLSNAAFFARAWSCMIGSLVVVTELNKDILSLLKSSLIAVTWSLSSLEHTRQLQRNHLGHELMSQYLQINVNCLVAMPIRSGVLDGVTELINWRMWSTESTSTLSSRACSSSSKTSPYSVRSIMTSWEFLTSCCKVFCIPARFFAGRTSIVSF